MGQARTHTAILLAVRGPEGQHSRMTMPGAKTPAPEAPRTTSLGPQACPVNLQHSTMKACSWHHSCVAHPDGLRHTRGQCVGCQVRWGCEAAEATLPRSSPPPPPSHSLHTPLHPWLATQQSLHGHTGPVRDLPKARLSLKLPGNGGSGKWQLWRKARGTAHSSVGPCGC